MLRMKHLLRKFHIGGGATDHQRRLPEPPPAAPAAELPPPKPAVAPSELAPAPATGGGSRCKTPAGEGFTFFEGEYQVQLALALSASDPDGIEEPRSASHRRWRRWRGLWRGHGTSLTAVLGTADGLYDL